MKQFTESELDAMSDRFDSEWSEQQSGAASIQRYLAVLGLHPTADRRLLSDLIQIDIERSWMNWAKALPSLILSMPPANILARFERLPRLRQYASIASDPICPAEFWVTVASCESRARDQWGDAVGPLHFEQHYDLTVEPSRYRRPRKLKCIPDDVSKVDPSEGIPLRGSTLIGRQRSTDALDDFVESNADGNRISVAHRFDPTISREQLFVQLIHPNYAVVKNLSKINAIAIVSADRLACAAPLNPSEMTVAEFPFDVRLPGRKLVFF